MIGFRGVSAKRTLLGLVLFFLSRFRGVSAERTLLGLVIFFLSRFRGVSAERTLLTLVIFSMLDKMAKCLARGFRRENTSDTCNFFKVGTLKK